MEFIISTFVYIGNFPLFNIKRNTSYSKEYTHLKYTTFAFSSKSIENVKTTTTKTKKKTKMKFKKDLKTGTAKH